MRFWVLPLVSVLVATAVGYVHITFPAGEGKSENPMLWASDTWTTWEQLRPSEVASEKPDGVVTNSGWVRRFRDDAGLEVWHVEQPWVALPKDWEQRPWRGGWLSGSSASLNRWVDSPGAMADHWKEGEKGARLEKTDCGWAWRADGWVVWQDREAGCVPEESVVGGEIGSTWMPAGSESPTFWWSGKAGSQPRSWPRAHVFDALAAEGIPVSSWGTWWEEGARVVLEESEMWRPSVESVAQSRGWTCVWVEGDAVINGREDWHWISLDSPWVARDKEVQWQGTSLDDGEVVVWTLESSEVRPASSEGIRSEPWFGSKNGGQELGIVRNHRTSTQMAVVQRDDGVVALDGDGAVVWGFNSAEKALPSGAQEVDVYANGKFQTMVCFPSGLHLLDVKGREVKGFPIQAKEGTWTAWALVDYESNRKYRYLVASSHSGLVENFRSEGERTPGWRHRPAEGIDSSSPVRHIEHLRLGSRDYLYVGRENGQIELLKRDGSTRATSPVRVNAQTAPVFRIGANLDRTSVLFVDGTGWVREFTLGQGEEVGLSGLTRADRVESVDVDGDGRDETVTWYRGERSVWNARNERMD